MIPSSITFPPWAPSLLLNGKNYISLKCYKHTEPIRVKYAVKMTMCK